MDFTKTLRIATLKPNRGGIPDTSNGRNIGAAPRGRCNARGGRRVMPDPNFDSWANKERTSLPASQVRGAGASSLLTPEPRAELGTHWLEPMGPRALVLILLVGWCGRDLATATPVYADQHDAAPPSQPDPQQHAADHHSENSAGTVTQGSTSLPHVSTQTARPSTALHVLSHAVNGAHHHPSLTTFRPETPTPSSASVPQAVKTTVTQKLQQGGEDGVPEGRRRRPGGYNRPYYPQRPYRPYNRPYRPYNRPGYQRPGYPSRYPYRPYFREHLIDPEFEPYDDPAYRRSSSLGYVLDAFVRVITRIASVGKTGKPSTKGSPTTNGTTSTGPGTDVTSTGPPPVDNGDDSNLTSTPPQTPPDESIFYSIGDVTGPFKFLVALAEVPTGMHAPVDPHVKKQPWGTQRPASKPGTSYVGVIEDEEGEDVSTPSPVEVDTEQPVPEEENDEPATPETHPPVYF
ncbi:hypothetical protein HPB50_018930 [Hyalomma asiaticum]|uniref:Uncharacterized protein n=1 Tax=Hyalomma asiaticum TaxID=266040 RepID=A0ACB7SRG8_HYAAI|nr:hypothetical protein HPB50_018930 [Hyalomma asiaticum]